MKNVNTIGVTLLAICAVTTTTAKTEIAGHVHRCISEVDDVYFACWFPRPRRLIFHLGFWFVLVLVRLIHP